MEGEGEEDGVGVPVVVNRFTGAVVTVHVEKRPGSEQKSLLYEDPTAAAEEEEEEEATGLFGSISKSVTVSLFVCTCLCLSVCLSCCRLFQKDKSPPPHPADPSSGEGTNTTINIFSVASGHLYERFLRYERQ